MRKPKFSVSLVDAVRSSQISPAFARVISDSDGTPVPDTRMPIPKSDADLIRSFVAKNSFSPVKARAFQGEATALGLYPELLSSIQDSIASWEASQPAGYEIKLDRPTRVSFLFYWVEKLPVPPSHHNHSSEEPPLGFALRADRVILVLQPPEAGDSAYEEAVAHFKHQSDDLYKELKSDAEWFNPDLWIDKPYRDFCLLRHFSLTSLEVRTHFRVEARLTQVPGAKAGRSHRLEISADRASFENSTIVRYRSGLSRVGDPTSTAYLREFLLFPMKTLFRFLTGEVNQSYAKEGTLEDRIFQSLVSRSDGSAMPRRYLKKPSTPIVLTGPVNRKAMTPGDHQNALLGFTQVSSISFDRSLHLGGDALAVLMEDAFKHPSFRLIRNRGEADIEYRSRCSRDLGSRLLMHMVQHIQENSPLGGSLQRNRNLTVDLDFSNPDSVAGLGKNSFLDEDAQSLVRRMMDLSGTSRLVRVDIKVSDGKNLLFVITGRLANPVEVANRFFKEDSKAFDKQSQENLGVSVEDDAKTARDVALQSVFFTITATSRALSPGQKMSLDDLLKRIDLEGGLASYALNIYLRALTEADIGYWVSNKSWAAALPMNAEQFGKRAVDIFESKALSVRQKHVRRSNGGADSLESRDIFHHLRDWKIHKSEDMPAKKLEFLRSIPDRLRKRSLGSFWEEMLKLRKPVEVPSREFARNLKVKNLEVLQGVPEWGLACLCLWHSQEFAHANLYEILLEIERRVTDNRDTKPELFTTDWSKPDSPRSYQLALFLVSIQRHVQEVYGIDLSYSRRYHLKVSERQLDALYGDPEAHRQRVAPDEDHEVETGSVSKLEREKQRQDILKEFGNPGRLQDLFLRSLLAIKSKTQTDPQLH